jgi:hypothetical protein
MSVSPSPRPDSATPSESLAAGSNRHFQHSLTASVAADAIWTLWTDVASWPEWDAEVLSATAQAPLALGVRGTLVPKVGRPSGFQISAWRPRSMYAVTTSLPLASLIVTRSLVTQGTSVTITHDVRFSGPLGGVFALLFGPRFRRVLPAVMTTLVALAQSRRINPS